MAQTSLPLNRRELSRRLSGVWARQRQAILFAAFSAVALAAFFQLPYLIPKKPSASWSYAFGYNNQAAILLLLLFTCIGALWLRRSTLFATPVGTDVRISRKALVLALAGTAVVCAAAWRLVVSATPVADAGYIIDRIQLTAAGLKPYIDFEFAYGPAFLYPPLWIARVLHIQIAAAYYCVWIIAEIGGVLLLYRVINEIDIPSRAKSTIFLLFCAASAAAFIIGALSYTLLRFALAPYAGLSVLRLNRAASGGIRRAISVPIAVTLWYLGLLMVSPDVALAFAIGTTAFLFLARRRGSIAWWAGYLAMLGSILAVSIAADALHLLDTLKNFGGGNRDFPIFPAGHILLFLLCVFLGMLHLARRIFSGPDSTSVCVILVSIPMLASALGSADPLHVFFGGLGFLLAGLLYLSQWRRSWELTRIGFSVFFVLLIFVGLYGAYAPKYYAKLRGFDDPHITRQAVFPETHGVLQAPFGFGAPEFLNYRLPWVDQGRFMGSVNATSVRDVDIKISEMASHPERDVLVPETYRMWAVFDAPEIRLWLEVEYGAPYRRPLKHSVNPYSELCAYLVNNYHQITPPEPISYQFAVWGRNR